ncbi:hypothetical protein E3O42_09570 [Cryobacterium adonitolivorans]|uniref:Lipoprotein n=1 Tax=Cryobacterium adonitolivorans TaxID=1259189 RepID=A0A4R8W771_9MICO|nr:hypothetical protein [Cryobacterium adonitolivorans]TFC01613.1 hypothetical protein E3O42_09570 [Cryobacterium adonitolivorans]
MNLRPFAPMTVALLLLTGCSAPAPDANTAASDSQPEAATAEPTEEVLVTPLDLAGEWKQTNSNSTDAYQTATITGEQITVNWVNDAEATKAVYWIGSYAAPTEDTESYSWDSQGDVAQMENAILASGDSAKTFTYKDGVLTYELTAMGVTMTVEMNRQ